MTPELGPQPTPDTEGRLSVCRTVARATFFRVGSIQRSRRTDI